MNGEAGERAMLTANTARHDGGLSLTPRRGEGEVTAAQRTDLGSCRDGAPHRRQEVVRDVLPRQLQRGLLEGWERRQHDVQHHACTEGTRQCRMKAQRPYRRTRDWVRARMGACAVACEPRTTSTNTRGVRTKRPHVDTLAVPPLAVQRVSPPQYLRSHHTAARCSAAPPLC
jgi:hypothetical protein